MRKKDEKRTRRIRKLIICFVFTAIILSASTFAWFIGMRTVNVSSFDVEISGTDTLMLSLDGERWYSTIEISEAELDNVSYQNHTNTWGGKGLAPVSSVGDMDVAASRMKLFEKSSMTASPGGYRIMSSQIKNNGAQEASGYVAFDLFIRNFSGRQYNENLYVLDEEAIYLTIDSKAETSIAGGVPDTGIENSVRVAFAQIGRVSGYTTDPAVITGIACNDDGSGNPTLKDGVTGICRKAQIWEPNDKAHVASAIKWYNKSCKARTGIDVTAEGSYSGSCGTITNNVTYPTYAINAPIIATDNVDIYDGKEYNSYEDTTLLTGYRSFTDSMKVLPGTSREEIFTLAPNSITKVRVYIYIEGQDIDNYDFASIGKAISVQFGFTKQRFVEGDIGYDGPALTGNKTTKPVITLLGQPEVTINQGDTYTDDGATAFDDVDGDLTRKIQTINPVNTNVPGTYYVTYNVSDWWGNYAAQVSRKVIVNETP